MSAEKRRPDPGQNKAVMYTTLREGMLEDYIRRHEEIPIEVVKNLKLAGISHLSLLHLPGTNVLILNIEKSSASLDLQRAIGPDSAYRVNPICDEWEKDMETNYHHGWTELDEIHSSAVEWNQRLGLID